MRNEGQTGMAGGHKKYGKANSEEDGVIKNKLYFKISFFYLFFTCVIFAQGLQEINKRYIHEIEIPATKKFATGFVFSDSVLGYVLATCRHVVQDSTGNIVDSILVRKNRLIENNQCIADTNKYTIHLKIDGNGQFYRYPKDDIDLVIISFSEAFNNNLKDEYIHGMKAKEILSKDSLNKIGLHEGTEVELVGFSYAKNLDHNSIHYHFSRFGKISLYTSQELTIKIGNRKRCANFLFFDMTIRGGDSGSPVYAIINKERYLIGLSGATTADEEMGIGYPIYYLREMIDTMRTRLTRK